MMNKTKLSIAIAAAAGISWGAGAQAGVAIPIAADGVNVLGSQVTTLDWTPGNAMSVPINPPSDSVVSPVGGNFNTYAHASLGNFVDENGNPITGSCLNATCEWTYVAGFAETFTTSPPNPTNLTQTFAVASGLPGGVNFFQIWYDPYATSGTRSDMLSGKQFNDGVDGTGAPNPILTGVITGGGGVFSAVASQPALDGVGTNNYLGITTITGNGSTTLDVQVTAYDPAFFQVAPKELTLQFTTQQKLAFDQANPSSCFWDGTKYINGAGPYNNAPPGTPTGCPATSVGPANGISGPNVMFQADASNDFNSNVPEPASLALLGIGLATMGATFNRRRLSKLA